MALDPFNKRLYITSASKANTVTVFGRLCDE